jgi:hypothetical protein
MLGFRTDVFLSLVPRSWIWRVKLLTPFQSGPRIQTTFGLGKNISCSQASAEELQAALGKTQALLNYRTLQTYKHYL